MKINYVQIGTAEEVHKVLSDIKKMILENSWENEFTYPYGSPVRAGDFLKNLDGFENMTSESKEISIDEINGFIKHFLEPRIKYLNEPKINVMSASGEIKTVTHECWKIVNKDGLAEQIGWKVV